MILASRDSGFLFLRTVAAGIGLLVLWVLALWLEAPGNQIGRDVFRAFEGVWCLALFVFGIQQSAPGMLKERELGTLGLLFLTSMKAWEVVAGKLSGALLRVGILWAAGWPVGMVPVVVGAVGGLEVVEAWIWNLACGIGGIAAGTIHATSTRRVESGLAGTWGFGLAFGFGVLGLYLMGLAVTSGFGWGGALLRCLLGLAAIAGAGGLCLALGTVMVGVRWRDDAEPPPPPPEESSDWAANHEARVWEQAWRAGPGKVMRGRSPLVWMRLRVPGRVVLWWLWAGIVLIGWFAAVATERVLPALCVAVLLTVGMAARASGGHRREVLSGAMELILTTPLPERTYFLSRVRLVCREFWVALVVYLLMSAWAATVSVMSARYPVWQTMWVLAMPWIAPMAGLVVAAYTKRVLPAVFGTAGLTLVWPWLGGLAAAWIGGAGWAAAVMGGVLLVGGVILTLWALHEHRSRGFVLRLMRS